MPLPSVLKVAIPGFTSKHLTRVPVFLTFAGKKKKKKV